MSNKQKLELTWIGKGEQPKLEPRILIEDKEKSFGNPLSENMLIHGDNLLALKALEQDFAGKIKCIYIDPPFNTGAAFENYDDTLEHSTWLNLLNSRIRFLYRLLSDDGSIFIHLDDNEIDYLKIIMDETFGRKNFIARITIDVRSPSAFSTVNPGVFKASEYLLWYAKNRESFSENPLKIRRQPDYAYNKWIENPRDHYSKWIFKTIGEAYDRIPKPKTNRPEKVLEHYHSFIINNAEHLWRPTEISDTGAGRATVEAKSKSLNSPNQVVKVEREDYDPIYIYNGSQMSFYDKNISSIDGELSASTFLTNIWTDIAWEGIAKEGGITFRKGKKPEKLIRRCLQLASNVNDWVLDSFLGSGTTAAVAHKMGRRWIGIELGEHCETHCLPRLKRVLEGVDQGGITKLEKWQGGGGFKYYELAPSLLKQDQHGNWIIDERYNANMLAAAMAKQEGYTYNPNQETYWKQGQSTEKAFIFTTTQFVTVETIDKIHEEMQPEESLLICCKAFQQACNHRNEQITVKKIPNMLLGRCEFGKEDYSLNIINMPRDPNEQAFIPLGPKPEKEQLPPNQTNLFEDE